MSLRFIYGRSGSGKTYYCLQEIKERLQHSPEHALVLLVPEQYTFQAERELMAITAQGGLWEAEVLSFRRLAFKVFNQAGGLAYPHLQAAGKCMLIYKVLQGLKEQLPFFSKSAERQGFVTTISTLLTEFKRYNISPQELIVAGDALTDELLKVKLAELAAIYKEYQDLLSESYRDLDDDYYVMDEKNYCLVGRRYNKKYQLGDELTVKVAKANLDKKQLDFVLA